MVEQVEAVVVGAGVVGLAVARELALNNLEVILLESASTVGSETSSHNSGVIHAGIYYPADSLKARLCVRGKQLLYRYCEKRQVPHQRVGKLIVASSAAQLSTLETLRTQAQENGVNDLVMLSTAEIARMEPDIQVASALYSPSTGIVDSAELMLSYQGDLEAAGGLVALNSPLNRVQARTGGYRLDIGGSEPMQLDCQVLVNSTGLNMAETLKNIAGFPARLIPPLYFARGNYFALSGRSPFTHLVYPVPEAAGLGIHATLDLAGRVRFGPDVEWVDRPDYQVSGDRIDQFHTAIAAYYPAIEKKRLTPDYAGIRPKLSPPGGIAADFVIQSEELHGMKGLINLLGIESPGLTSSLAIAELVGEHLGLTSSEST